MFTFSLLFDRLGRLVEHLERQVGVLLRVDEHRAEAQRLLAAALFGWLARERERENARSLTIGDITQNHTIEPKSTSVRGRLHKQ